MKRFLMANIHGAWPNEVGQPWPDVFAGLFGEEKLLVLPQSLTMTDWQAVSCTALGKPLICQDQHL